MQTLTYGLKRPETGDKGSVFFPALEDNITQLDAHSHNGTDSTKLTSAALSLNTSVLLASDWVPFSTGTWRQAVTLPNAMSYMDKIPVFRNTATKDQLYLTAERISDTQFYVYINDNSIGVTVVYI